MHDKPILIVHTDMPSISFDKVSIDIIGSLRTTKNGEMHILTV